MDTINEPINEPNVCQTPTLNALDLADIEMKKEANRLRSKKWRQENKIQNNAYKRKYYQANCEKIKNYSKAYMKQYYKNFPEKKEQHNTRCRENTILMTDDEKDVKSIEFRMKQHKKAYDNSLTKANIAKLKYEDMLVKLNEMKADEMNVDVMNVDGMSIECM